MWFSLLLSLPFAQEAPAPAQTPDPAVAPAAVFTPLLSIHCAGVDALLVDSKDQNLLAALKMIDDRLLELPGEIPDFQAPPGSLELLVRILSGPMSLTIGMNSEPIPAMPMPFAGELRLTKGSDDSAKVLIQDVANYLQQMGVPLADPEEGGQWVLPAPVPVWMGSDADAVVLRLGLENGVSVPDTSHLLPPGANQTSGGVLAYGTLMKTFMPMIPGADASLMAIMDASLATSMDMEWASGIDGERSYSVFNMPGWGKAAREAGLISSQDLGQGIVEAIPSDATWAVASTINMPGLLGYYEKVMQLASGQDDLSFQEELANYLPLDLEADLLAPFGQQMAVYASDSTGGGGFLSTVFLVELADRAAFDRGWKKLEQHIAELGQQVANGYVRISHMEHGGMDLRVLSFPGLPIPLELSLTITEKYVVLGATPSAVVAAVGSIHGGQDNSLLANRYFQEQLPRDAATGQVSMDGVISISWFNTPRLMQDGYSAVSLACSALSNMVRSPRDVERSAGLILPPFGTLQKGAKAMLTVGRMVGDDLRTETRGDRSQLVNAAGVMGYMANSPVGPMMAGIAFGAMTARMEERMGQAVALAPIQHVHEAEPKEAEQETVKTEQEMMAEAQVQAIQLALQHYASNNGGTYPAELSALTARDVNGHAYLDESTLTDPWGNPFHYEMPTAPNSEPLVKYHER